jgi:two-component system sensor histidine kinase and response regulator WspE
VVRVDRREIQPVEGRQQFMLDGESVGLVDAADLLGVGAAAPAADGVRVVLLGQAGRCCGLVVDRFLGEQDLVVRPLDQRLAGVAHVSAAAVLENGDPLLILDVEDLFQSVQQLLGEGRLRGLRSIARDRDSQRRRRILVVDDSITVREAERQLLVRHGYEVDVAVDGRDGLNALRARPYDLLITDVDMPRLNGIELIRALRQEQRFADLPIVIVSYKDRQEDRLLGLEVGANAYLTKSSFHDDSLVATVGDLIGGAQS